jgi:hypothetical protein
MRLAALYKSEEEKVGLIERNLYEQFLRTTRFQLAWGKELKLTAQVVKELHYLAI